MMWLYHLRVLVVVGGEVIALKTETSACEGVYLHHEQRHHTGGDGKGLVSIGEGAR